MSGVVLKGFILQVGWRGWTVGHCLYAKQNGLDAAEVQLAQKRRIACGCLRSWCPMVWAAVSTVRMWKICSSEPSLSFPPHPSSLPAWVPTDPPNPVQQQRVSIHHGRDPEALLYPGPESILIGWCLCVAVVKYFQLHSWVCMTDKGLRKLAGVQSEPDKKSAILTNRNQREGISERRNSMNESREVTK